jgi:hypothetical protein
VKDRETTKKRKKKIRLQVHENERFARPPKILCEIPKFFSILSIQFRPAIQPMIQASPRNATSPKYSNSANIAEYANNAEYADFANYANTADSAFYATVA